MTTVTAEFQERKRIVFSARGRSSVNVREEIADGPIGFSSAELLLIAVANCSLGTLLGHPLLANENVRSVNATLSAEFASDPPRIASIRSVVELDVENAALADRVKELEGIGCTCPMCNSLSAKVSLELRLVKAG